MAENCRPATIEDLKNLLSALNENQVDYVLIGGYALFAHGLHRATTDIDLLVPVDKANGAKLLSVLMLLPDKAAANIPVHWFDEGEGISVADEILVDILFEASGQTFETLREFEELVYLDEIPLRTLSLEGLLRTKQTVRSKDAEDRVLIEMVLDSAKRLAQQEQQTKPSPRRKWW